MIYRSLIITRSSNKMMNMMMIIRDFGQIWYNELVYKLLFCDEITCYDQFQLVFFYTDGRFGIPRRGLKYRKLIGCFTNDKSSKMLYMVYRLEIAVFALSMKKCVWKEDSVNLQNWLNFHKLLLFQIYTYKRVLFLSYNLVYTFIQYNLCI